MSHTVLAAVAQKANVTQIQEFPMPEISENDGILRVEAVGVCGTDWPLYMKTEEPRILGHHVIGYIEKIGKNASERWNVKAGDRVALEEYIPCGSCKYCRSGDFRMCETTDLWTGRYRYGSTGISSAPSLFGGYSQYMYLHPNAVLHKQPEHVPADEAALALPISNGFEWACLEGGAGPGKTVLIQGPGQVGLGCVLAAKSVGADCVIISGLSADKRRLQVAKMLGADFTVDVENENLIEKVRSITGGEMADIVIDCSAGGVSTITTGIAAASRLGKIILGGYKHQPIPNFYSDEIIKKSLVIKGVRGHRYQSVEQAIRVIATGKYPLKEMCTHHYSLSEVDYALQTVGGKGEMDVISGTVFPWGS